MYPRKESNSENDILMKYAKTADDHDSLVRMQSLTSDIWELKEARKGFLLLQWLWNDGRLQRRIFNGVGKLYVSLQL